MNRLAVVNVVRAVEFVFPNGGAGDAHRVINRCGEVFWLLSVRGGVSTVLVGRADDDSTLRAATSNEDRLDRSPMIATGFATGTTVGGIHFGSAAHFSDHDNQCFFQHSERLQIVEQCRDASIRRRQQTIP